MADSSTTNPTERGDVNDATMDDDDITIVSGKKAKKQDYIEDEMVESTLRYEIPYKSQAKADDVHTHADLLELLTKVYDDNELRIYDNKNMRIKNFSAKKWRNKKYYNSHFGSYVDTAQKKTVVAHRIKSQKPLNTLKGDPSVIAFLKKTNTFLRVHMWQEDELELRDIGFLLSYVPSKHSKNFVTKDMVARTKSVQGTEWSSAPSFKLIHAQPKLKLQGKTKLLRTHAYSVQVKSKDAPAMNLFLRTIYHNEPLYMPYSMNKKFPQAVAKAIVKQNRLIADTYVIVMIGVSREVMAAIAHEELEDIPGFLGVSDTNKTDKNGRFLILVEEKTFIKTRKLISTKLQAWIRNCSTTIQATIPDTFPAPQVNLGFIDHDDDSSGHASYMSSCAQSYGSYDETDDIDDAFFAPTSTTFRPGQSPSYAAALSGNRPVIPVATVNTDQALPETVTIKAHRTAIAGLQAEVSIALLQAENAKLRSLLEAQASQTPSTVTEISTPDLHSNPMEARMMLMETNMNNMTTEFKKWMTEVSSSLRPSSASEPSGYGSQNSTSKNDRADGSTPTRPQSKKMDTRKSPRLDPMDTDRTAEAIELFPQQPSPPPSPGPLTQQENHIESPPRECDGKDSPELEHSPPFTNMAALLAANASPRSPTGYDSDNNHYVYEENDAGGLTCKGIAQPADYHPDGTIRGPQPTAAQNEMAKLMLQRTFHPSPSRLSLPYLDTALRPASPNTLATQEETEVSSTTTLQGPLSPSPEERDTVMGSPQRLPAEGAQPDHE
jgi:hypothetical protein